MKRIVKISLYGLLYLAVVIFLAVMFIATAKAELVKPNNGIEPFQVVKIQLRSLKKNDNPKLIDIRKNMHEYRYDNMFILYKNNQ